jgi:DNA-binding MarR family transcriptional regulator
LYVQLIALYLQRKYTIMSSISHSYLSGCLYFTANSLSRNITEMAKEEFAITGLDPSYAHLVLLLCDKPGLSQNELAQMMNLKPSTITRFIDKLQSKGLIEKIQEGRSSLIYPSDEGKAKSKLVRKALKSLYDKYCKVLGEEFAVKLTSLINDANHMIER